MIPPATQKEGKAESIGCGRTFSFGLGLCFVAYAKQGSRFGGPFVHTNGGETAFFLRREMNIFLWWRGSGGRWVWRGRSGRIGR
jgi:hypothetical protein